MTIVLQITDLLYIISSYSSSLEYRSEFIFESDNLIPRFVNSCKLFDLLLVVIESAEVVRRHKKLSDLCQCPP